MCEVGNSKHKLQRGIYARFRGHSDINGIRDMLWYPRNDQLWPGAENGIGPFSGLWRQARDRSVKVHEPVKVLRVQDRTYQPALGHVFTVITTAHLVQWRRPSLLSTKTEVDPEPMSMALTIRSTFVSNETQNESQHFKGRENIRPLIHVNIVAAVVDHLGPPASQRRVTFVSGNGCHSTAPPTQLARRSVAPRWPHRVQRARRRSLSREAFGPDRITQRGDAAWCIIPSPR